MMKRQMIIIIVLVLISAGVVFVLLNKSWSTVEVGFEGVMLASPEKADKIEVIGLQDTLIMQKMGDDWQLNGEEKLNPVPIQSLLYSSSKIRVISMITAEEAAEQQEYMSLGFYDGRKLLSSFRFMVIRGESIIYKEGADHAYIVELPGYDDLTLKKVFSDDPDHYRNHLMLSMLPEEIAMIEIWPLSGSRFTVIQDTTSQVAVKNFEDQEIAFSERKIRLLLSYFSAIRFEEYLPSKQIPSDLDFSSPSAKIVITDFKGISHILRIYAWTKSGENKPDLFNALVRGNRDPRVMIVNYTYLDLLIRGAETYLPSQ